MEIRSERIGHLIAGHPEVVKFGCTNDYVGDNWVAKAESILGWSLPPSYLWFLKNYGGGEIGSEEIYSIYGMDFNVVCGGDIVYHHIVGRKAGWDKSKLLISETDFGELFMFDCSSVFEGEYPILQRLPSGELIHYAADFYGFLYRRILAHLS
ncbi:hypothetical protein ACVW0A_001004 [Pseudomonas sp. TE3610]